MSSQKREPISLDLFEELPSGTCSGAASEGTGSPRKHVLSSRGTLEIGLTVTIDHDIQNLSQGFQSI